jgi:hypothetical protein
VASRTGEALNLNGMAKALCRHIPEGWDVLIRLVHDEIAIDLEDPEANLAEVCRDDLNTNEILLAHVNHARRAEGLPTVGVPGLLYEKEAGYWEVCPDDSEDRP